MENRAFDHIFGCMLEGKPGVDGIKSGTLIPLHNSVDGRGPSDATQRYKNVTCGTAQPVCHGPKGPTDPKVGGGFDRECSNGRSGL